jgi:small subunit ribosomal protein S17
LAKERQKTRIGVVTSNKMQKTVVVEVEASFRHPFYGKVMRATSRFKAHDEKNRCAIGDQVLIQETRPLSRAKNWRVVRILGKGKLRQHELPAKKESKTEGVKAVDSES